MSDTVVNLEHVSIFHNKNMVLNDVNFKVNRGDFVYLIGKTGSGKSSIMRLLYGDLPLKQGEASVAGFNLKTMKNREIPVMRRKLGIIFQDFQLLTDRTAKDNLTFYLRATGWDDKAKMEERVSEVLNKVNLSSKGFKMPQELSGGEQQRLVIARALLNDPDLILADEPTGNLDPETSNEIMNLLFEVSSNKRAVVMVTHNYNLIDKFPSRVVKVDQGKLSELGGEVQAWAAASPL
ncbi:MAG TPA: ATP-binding cassette domain-containing protein [Bacteroidia bacterium]|jgi:cell division transport system ATP-binding protein|nr:ATP-binding cassette domain-containing protein [Bacteroidia bacterium]HQF29140.1 ATP-binding cassette domain-containing protein [Bacteroidia bacterium]HQK98472.1 ATP-binding cassette domain-containing protein [Bacteroidia bacterium]